MDIDLAKFFDTVNHDKLMTIFGRTIKDGDVISVVRKFLVSGVMIDDEYEDTVVGTPQGNISPLLAYIMLNELDKEMEQRGLDFVRYAEEREQAYVDNTDRIEVERGFSLAKRCYGLGLIKIRLDTTTHSFIALSILAMNVDYLAAVHFALI